MKREEMHKNSGDPAPRCICNPNKVYKYIIGYVNKILVQAMVDADLGFSGLGLNMGQLCQLIERETTMLEDPIHFTADGSRHDAHQYASLLVID
jgi:hypothetical protein